MKKNKNKLLIFIVIFIILLFCLTVYFLIISYKKQSDNLYSNSRCYNLEKGFGGPIDIIIIDCIGYLRLQQSKLCGSIEQPKRCENIYIYDSLNHLSFIKNVDKYIFKSKSLYVIGDLDLNYGMNNNLEEYTYTVYLPINGEYKIIDYKDTESIPRYFVVNSETGDMILYNDYNQMSEEEKVIFKNLEIN
jgi:hypothetical protein